MKRILGTLVLFAALGLWLGTGGCGNKFNSAPESPTLPATNTPSPHPTGTYTPTVGATTPTQTQTPTPSATCTPTPSVTPTPTCACANPTLTPIATP